MDETQVNAATAPIAEVVPETAEPVLVEPVLVEEELLVEEISIDGMCGVY